MEIIISSIEKTTPISFINFFDSFKKINFSYINLNKLNLMNNKNVIIFIPPEFEKNSIHKINNLLKKESNFFIFLIPKTFDEMFFFNKNEKIIYPLMANRFEKKVLDLFSTKTINFENLYLNNKNILVNKFNGKSTYLTEIESEILKIFFEERVVAKNKLKTDVLKIKSEIESKTLEAHIYRLRKKISNISKEVSIINLNKDNLSIKKTNQAEDLPN
tara:strand:+ start:3009 stop:3659 length:651 start_codon:yes stop_codon:yes gene_type:complete